MRPTLNFYVADAFAHGKPCPDIENNPTESPFFCRHDPTKPDAKTWRLDDYSQQGVLYSRDFTEDILMRFAVSGLALI